MKNKQIKIHIIRTFDLEEEKLKWKRTRTNLLKNKKWRKTMIKELDRLANL